MRDVLNNVITKGTKVKLALPKSRYVLGPGNPAIGTEWECAGVYVGGCRVVWDNGSHNSYSDRELKNIDDSCISIWGN